MTIDEAIKELLNATDFKQKLKGNDKLRIYQNRIESGKATTKVKIDLLVEFGYLITVESPYKLVRKNGK